MGKTADNLTLVESAMMRPPINISGPLTRGLSPIRTICSTWLTSSVVLVMRDEIEKCSTSSKLR